MRVRAWNAYASNNSGSYTLVGSLPSTEIARDVAALLAKVIAAHDAWMAQHASAVDTSGSPLAALCREHGLTLTTTTGSFDEWPYAAEGAPAVTNVGRQVVVHHPFTLSLPASFGELLYRRGGRVDHEENHAHHPIVVTATFRWGWSEPERARAEVELPRLLDTLVGPEGPLTEAPVHPGTPAWRVGEGHEEGSILVGVVFADLVEGVEALQRAADAHGATLSVRVQEAPDDTSDPMAWLRPSRPPPPTPRFDIIVEATAATCEELEEAVWETLCLRDLDIEAALATLPGTLARSVPEPRARAAAAALEQACAQVALVRNDG